MRTKLVIISGVAAFLLTLLSIPVDIHLLDNHYSAYRTFWEIREHESIRFSIIGVWWAGIFAITEGLWLLARK